MPLRRFASACCLVAASSLIAASACATAEDTEPSGRPRDSRGGNAGTEASGGTLGSSGAPGTGGASGSGNSGGSGGANGSTGADGSAAAAGTAGGTDSGPAGSGGSGGIAGAAGTNGSAGANGRGGTSGSTGSGGAGSGGTSGASGTSGRGGTSGTGGTTGASGTGGTAGTTGTGGSAGTGGTAGTAGTAGTGGTGGTAGGGPTCSTAGFVFCDDFEDGNAGGWTTTGGTWSVISDQSYVYAGGSGSYNSTAGSSYGDQTVEARMKVLQFGGSGSSYRAGLIARYGQSSNFYALTIDAAGDVRLLRGSSSPSGASGTCDAVASGLSSVTNTWMKLRLRVSGSASSVRILSWLNDAPLHDCTTTSSTLASGSVGVMSYGSSTRAEFDDFRVSTP